jgi:hypothetical protein
VAVAQAVVGRETVVMGRLLTQLLKLRQVLHITFGLVALEVVES